ncbi:protein P21-like [Impatiens glandulifera]|uniref:protein P21-like n=1 Tax=Impatiens glandulifera TaxID=253017 RepID=UPI001FB0EC47|nr:protein P21-like [Impatiens glandulifera]
MVSFSFSINSLLVLTSLLFPTFINATIFTITNNCSFPVWAASIPGGGRYLQQSKTWILNPPEQTINARIWARTNCNFNRSGHGSCQTGDCNGLLECQTNGSPPNTLAEYALDQFNNLDFFDMSLVDGFNVPMQFSPTSNECTTSIRCTSDIIGQCPKQLLAPGGCNNPCTVFKTDQYCCNSGSCVPTNFSRFFKDRCPDAYSYPKDDPTSTFTCPGGTDYNVVFCPGSESIKTRTVCPRNSTISIPPPAKITVVAPAFKSCNKQFYVSLS